MNNHINENSLCECIHVTQANQREEEYKNQIKTLTTRLKEVHARGIILFVAKKCFLFGCCDDFFDCPLVSFFAASLIDHKMPLNGLIQLPVNL